MFREIMVGECENWKKCVHSMTNAMLLDVTVRCFSEKKERKTERNSKTTDVPLSTQITTCPPPSPCLGKLITGSEVIGL